MSRTPTADELRELWLGFFAERGHALPAAASLVPENDPTLLFTGAGMNQFKEYFLGKVEPPFRRAATVQPCFRQGDLENVGRTPRHLTFFEMMGHFSFGDYFKKDAVAWAWTFMTRVLGIPAERLLVSIYREDEQAFEAWRAVGVPADRIARFDAKENFWPADAPEKGPDGVCGPCSEVFFDYGASHAVGDGGPGQYDSGRYIEIWNSVFTQYERRGRGNLVELPQRNIDCGVGFERVLAAVEGQYSVFSTSLFRPLLERLSAISGVAYPFLENGDLPAGEDMRRMRRIADHVRAACFLVAAGVKPSNEGRGYVLRRILRLAIRDGIQLGVDEPFLDRVVPTVVSTMGRAHPALIEGATVLASVLSGEEERFRATYEQGMRFLDDAARHLSRGDVLGGEAAFKLHDTYGFPVDLAARILEERGIDVDLDGFESAMEQQRERARRGSKIQDAIFVEGPLSALRQQGVPETVFLGYDRPEAGLDTPDGRGVRAEADIVGLIRGDALVASVEAGDDVRVVLDRTPFYAESGGQVGDRGVLAAEGLRIEILDTQAQEGYTLHRGRVASGRAETGHRVVAEVDEERRDATRRNHTATHLLHAALKCVLGDHVRQEGSLVAPDALRFDFSHPRALTSDEIHEVERLANAWILRNDPLDTAVMELDKAKASGAVSLFGEKYGDVVRVVSIASGSRELCGGTHCRLTGDIGSFRITHETSIAAGIRRIEAVTGRGAVERAGEDREVVQGLASMLKAGREEIVGRVEALIDELKAVRKADEKARREAGLAAVGRLVEEALDVDGLRLQAASLPGVDGKALRGVWDGLRQGGVDVAILVGEAGGKAPLLVGLSKTALGRGLDAKTLLREATEVLGGGGGGRSDLAQGRGEDRGRIDEALERIRTAARDALV